MQRLRALPRSSGAEDGTRTGPRKVCLNPSTEPLKHLTPLKQMRLARSGFEMATKRTRKRALMHKMEQLISS